MSGTQHQSVGPCPKCWSWSWRFAGVSDPEEFVVEHKKRRYVCRLCDMDRSIVAVSGQVGNFGVALCEFFNSEAAKRIDGNPGFELFRAQSLEAIATVNHITARVNETVSDESEDVDL